MGPVPAPPPRGRLRRLRSQLRHPSRWTHDAAAGTSQGVVPLPPVAMGAAELEELAACRCPGAAIDEAGGSEAAGPLTPAEVAL